MPKRAIFVLMLAALSISSVQAEDLILPSEAQQIAQGLIQRNAAYYAVHPERATSNIDWRQAEPADPILVHTFPDLEPCYYMVPALNTKGQTICLIGVSARVRKWQWYASANKDRFPPVSQAQAMRICQGLTDRTEVSHPVVVEMPNKRFYWFCSVSGDSRRQILVNINDASEVVTSLDPGFSELTTAYDLPEIQTPFLNERIEQAENKDSPYPSFYNIEVPFHYQDSSFYCGEAALGMAFDYWGPEIDQDDIGDVADVLPYAGTEPANLIRASHFSWISTAIQNPALEGYHQRPLGYSGNYQSWNRISHFITRYEDLKNLISNDYPIVMLTWYSEYHTVGHYRVVKGYDDELDVFMVHDPWYSPPYWGPDFHFNQAFLVDDLWLIFARWGLFSAPWRVDVAADSLVGTEQLFSVSAEFEYRGPHPFENQYVADSIQATIILPSGYQLVDSPSAVIDFGAHASGYADSVAWQVSAPSSGSGPDTIRVEVKGKVTGSSDSYPSYQDWIGGYGGAELITITFVDGDANGDGLIDLGDAVWVLNYLFKGGLAPVPAVAGDANCDGTIDLGDVVHLLNYLFKGGPAPCE